MKRFWKVIIFFSLILPLCTGCGSKNDSNQSKDEPEKLTIAYQPSVGYAPLIVMQELGLIEEHYDGDIVVDWTEVKNAAAINEGLVSGAIDVGSMGLPAAVTAIQAGSPCKIAFGLSSQPYSILTNSDRINSLRDITDADQIAIMGTNTQPHILLAMAAKEYLGDARALDKNLTILSNPDGYSAMVSGAVPCHIVVSPFNFMEISNEDASIHEIEIDGEVWPPENTALVTLVTKTLKEKNPKIYEALLLAVEDAMKYIEENPEKTAEMLAKGYDATSEEILRWITDERSSYKTELVGLMDVTGFMVEEGFIDNGPDSFNDLVYENGRGN